MWCPERSPVTKWMPSVSTGPCRAEHGSSGPVQGLGPGPHYEEEFPKQKIWGRSGWVSSTIPKKWNKVTKLQNQERPYSTAMGNLGHSTRLDYTRMTRWHSKGHGTTGWATHRASAGRHLENRKSKPSNPVQAHGLPTTSQRDEDHCPVQEISQLVSTQWKLD